MLVDTIQALEDDGFQREEFRSDPVFEFERVMMNENHDPIEEAPFRNNVESPLRIERV
jgi:hypothetical protein